MHQPKFLFLVLCTFFLFFGCKPSSDSVNVNVNVAQEAPNAADGFDLEQFHKVLIEEGENENTWNAQFLSDLVNREDVNNIDLNANGIVDTILVEPFDGGETMKGFTLYTKVVDEAGETADQEQTIATIVIEKEGDKGTLTVSGNEQVYGNHYHYRSGNLSTFFLMYWMFSPRMSYGSAYRSSYRSSYPSRQRASTSAYRGAINKRNTAFQGTKAPKATRPSSVTQTAAKQRTAAKGIKSKLNNPTSSQRAFKAQSAASKKASGFGKNSSGTRSSSSSGRTRTSFGK